MKSHHYSGQISHWILGKTLGNSFIGSLSANCSDRSPLPKITYGFNGTTKCADGLYNESAVSNEGYKLLGNFSYRYSSLVSFKRIPLALDTELKAL